MGCSSVASAFKGERDVSDGKTGGGVLDKIAAASKAMQVAKAEREMKKERADWKPNKSFAGAEDEAPEADWWDSGGGAVTDQPKDDDPFGGPEVEEEISDPEDYDYDVEAWEDYDEEGDYDVDGPSVQLPQSSSSLGVAVRPSQISGSAPPGRSPPKAGAKSSNDPWGDSSSDDDSPAQRKTQSKSKPKPKATTANVLGTDDSEEDRNAAATKIQSIARGGATRSTKGKGKGKGKGKAAAAAKAKDPWADDSDSSDDQKGGMSSPTTAPDSRQSAKPTPKRSPKSSEKARLLPGKKSSQDSTSQSSGNDPPPRPSRPPPARPKSKAKGNGKGSSASGPRSTAMQVRKSASLQESSDDDDDNVGGKVMF